MNENKKEELLQKILNNLHRATLKIPELKGYKKIESDSSTILIAKSDDNAILQFLEDGKLEDNETFDNRIEKVLIETQKAMQDNGFRNQEIILLENMKTDKFDFQIFLQDNIVGNTQIRQINAYFIEPESRYFYEITISAPPLERKYVNQSVLNKLYEQLSFVLHNLDYNDQIPFN